MAFRSDYDFQTVFKLLDYSSINLNCCINTQEYLILMIKENCQTVVAWGGLGREDCHESDTCIGLV